MVNEMNIVTYCLAAVAVVTVASEKASVAVASFDLVLPSEAFGNELADLGSSVASVVVVAVAAETN